MLCNLLHRLDYNVKTAFSRQLSVCLEGDHSRLEIAPFRLFKSDRTLIKLKAESRQLVFITTRKRALPLIMRS